MATPGVSPCHLPASARRRFALGAAWLAVACIMACGLAGCRDADSKPARQVVVYCSVDDVIAEPILAEFERSRGIKVLARYDTEAQKTVGLVQRLRSESARPVADVFWSNEIFHTVRLATEGLFERCQYDVGPPWPKEFTDAQGRWRGFALRARAVAYHTGRVPAAEAPRRLEDLLDKKWRGRLVMASPEFGTTCGHVASWFVLYGPQRATAILQGLKDNDLRLVDGNSTAVRMVGTGQADVALTDTDDVYAAQRNGWPVAMNLLRHGEAGPLVIPNTVALVRGAPHQGEARELVQFLLSESVEAALARSDAHNTPVRAALAAQFPALSFDAPLAVDYDAVADAIPEAIRVATKILK